MRELQHHCNAFARVIQWPCIAKTKRGEDSRIGFALLRQDHETTSEAAAGIMDLRNKGIESIESIEGIEGIESIESIEGISTFCTFSTFSTPSTFVFRR